MAYLYALIALFGTLTLLNLLLTFGIIRRLRRRPANTTLVTYSGFPAPGSLVGDFADRDLTGRPVSRMDLAGRTVVGFFSPGCDACRDGLAGFVTAARSQPSLAVVMSDAASAAEYLPSLTPVSRVVLQEPDGPLIAAFTVTAFPSFFVVEAGRIVAGSVTLDDLPISAAA
ncbi:hypothetical protein AB0G04_27600 [Actinoplanes sp. NPDC023801]|uniref:hypothetical protein n=1 Tax=Actinoplanes sp. NPDC023801 TaxID=3154595 RepID=UPI0033F3B44A